MEHFVFGIVGREIVVDLYWEHHEAVTDEGDYQLGAPVAAAANIEK